MDKKGWREISSDELTLRDRLNDVEPHKGWVFTNYTQGVEMVYVELRTCFFSRSPFSRRYWEPDEGIRVVPNFEVTFLAPNMRDGSRFGGDINEQVLNPDELEYLLRYNFRGLGLFDGRPDFRSVYEKTMEEFKDESSEE